MNDLIDGVIKELDTLEVSDRKIESKYEMIGW